MKKINQLSFVLLVMMVASVARAAVYDVTAVLNGTDGGFGFSGFHFAGDFGDGMGTGINNDGNPMTGLALVNIPSKVGYLGSYNDVSGAFDVTLDTSTSVIPSFRLNGTLLFNSSGLLEPTSPLNITFNTLLGSFTTGMDFSAGQVCCSGLNPPNSFDGNLLSLWGANSVVDLNALPGGVVSSFPSIIQLATNPLIGLDLRLQLTAVPVPAAIWLFASGIIGLLGMATRRSICTRN